MISLIWIAMTKNTTSSGRIFSASIANWIGMGVTLLSQLAFVPIYLSYWSSDIYGAWLLLMAFLGFAGMVQGAHRDFLFYETLKLGKSKMNKVSLQLSSALPFVFIVSLIVVLVTYAQYKFNLFPITLGLESNLKEDFLLSTVLTSLAILFTSSYYGYLLAPLILLGYYPLITWIKVIMSFIISIVPVIIVIYGGDLVQAVIGLALSTIIVNFIVIFHLLRLYNKENISFTRPNWILGLQQLLESFWLFIKHFSDSFRQVSIRFLIVPFISVTGVAQFSTNRTVANVAQQGMMSLTGPILPELMHFIHEKKQDHIDSVLAILWLMLCCFIAPGFIILQVFIEPLFNIWTAGAIEFNPLLFSLLSISILLITLTQPAENILRGNNLYKIQLSISLVALLGLVTAIFVGSEKLNVIAAGIGLLVAETLVMVLSVWSVYRWMLKNGLVWPWKYFIISLISVLVTSFALITLALEENLSALFIVSIIFIQFSLAFYLFRSLPDVATQKLDILLKRFRRS